MVEEKLFINSDNVKESVTISLGISTWDVKYPLEFEELLNHADQALSQAKEAGRN